MARGLRFPLHDMFPARDDTRPDRLMDTAERRFRDLVHGVDAIVWEADAASLACTFVSQRAEDLLGYPIERWLGATDFWGEIVDARDRHRVLARYGEALTAERPLEPEFRVTTADGRQVWRRARVHPADRGRLRGIMIDVTEHRRLQAERDELLLREQVARNEMESAAEMVQRLETITEAALSDLSQEHLLRRVLERIRDVLEADGALILLPTEDGEGLRVMGAVGLELEDDVRVPMDDSLSGRIAMSRRAVLVEDAGRTDPDIPALWRAHVRSLVGVPLSVDGHSVGVVHAVRLARRRFSADDARLLQLVGDRLGVAIRNARLYEAERRARLALEAATQRAAFLADAVTALAAAPDPADGLADVARLAVPLLADWCAVDLREPDGFRRVAVVHRDPAAEARAAVLLGPVAAAAPRASCCKWSAASCARRSPRSAARSVRPPIPRRRARSAPPRGRCRPWPARRAWPRALSRSRPTPAAGVSIWAIWWTPPSTPSPTRRGPRASTSRPPSIATPWKSRAIDAGCGRPRSGCWRRPSAPRPQAVASARDCPAPARARCWP